MLVRDAELADGRVRDVLVEGERIAAVAPDLSDQPAGEGEIVDANGRLLLPGMVDAHVHCREPGDPHKETWETATRSAAVGGVTTVVDQPNTDPPTVSGAAYERKTELAAAARVDYGLNGGVTPDWDPDSLFDRPLVALGEVFLADSTGGMGIEADRFADAVDRATAAGVTVTVHAEDASLFDEDARDRDGAGAWSAYRTAEAEIAAIERACAVADDVGAQIHVAHTSTPEGIDRAADAGMSCEVTPHHLLLSREDLDDLGTFGRMNPPLRSEERRRAVLDRVADGTVDLIATDHAPHTRAEKEGSVWEVASGVPGVETALPLFLNLARQGTLSRERVRELTATAPAERFGLDRKGRVAEGYDADLVLVDPDDPRPIRAADLHTKADWTPFEGMQGIFPELTLVRGEVAYRRETGAFGGAIGENVRARGG